MKTSQKDIVEKQLKEYGEVSRNFCLKNYISRLSAIIQKLEEEGWEFEPTYKMPWTKPYYISFFENYGFKDYFQQYVYVSSISTKKVLLPSIILSLAPILVNIRSTGVNLKVLAGI
jgi:hypothetical protein